MALTPCDQWGMASDGFANTYGLHVLMGLSVFPCKSRARAGPIQTPFFYGPRSFPVSSDHPSTFRSPLLLLLLLFPQMKINIDFCWLVSPSMAPSVWSHPLAAVTGFRALTHMCTRVDRPYTHTHCSFTHSRGHGRLGWSAARVVLPQRLCRCLGADCLSFGPTPRRGAAGLAAVLRLPSRGPPLLLH